MIEQIKTYEERKKELIEKAKEINPEDVEKFLKFAAENNISSILAHAPYTLNAASAD